LPIFIGLILVLGGLTGISYGQQTNVSLLYGWNGTVWTPLKTDPTGILMSTLNFTESVGMNPQLDNSYDLGNATFRWRGIYGMNTFANSFLGINTTTVAGIVRVAVNGTNVFNINETGRVGINVTNPSGIFHVAGGGQANAIVVGTNGAVGIGTANPVQTLTVAGDLNVTGNLITSANVTNIDTIGNMIVGRNLTVGGTNLFVNNASGYVGIGTTSPSYKLQVRNDSSAAYSSTTGIPNVIAFLQNPTSGANNNVFLAFGTEANGEIYLGAVQNAANTRSDLAVKLWSGSDRVERFRITSDGNVGIGTTSPLEKLHLVGSIFVNNTGVATSTAAFNSSDITLQSSAWNGSVATAYNATLRHIATNGTGNLTRLGITVNGTEAVSISSLGNVGIGTTGPGSPLDVRAAGNGLFNFQATTGTNAVYGSFVNTGGSGIIGTESSTGGTILTGSTAYALAMRPPSGKSIHFGIGSGASVTMTLDNNGNVGIGTTGPGSPLDVRAAGNGLFNFQATTGTNAVYGSFVNTGGSGIIGTESSTGGTILTGSTAYALAMRPPSGKSIHFGIGSGASVTMTLDNNGNVGIGTTGPQTKLDVTTGALGTHAISLDQGMAIGWRDASNNLGGASIVGNSGATGQLYLNAGSSGSIIFQTGNVLASGNPSWNTGATPKMTILSGGNVGIGTTGPQTKLDVTTGALGTHAISLDQGMAIGWRDASNNLGGASIVGNSGATGQLYLNAGSSGSIIFQTGNVLASGNPSWSTGATPKMTILTGGNVGIGTTGPTAKLDIIGNLTINGTATTGPSGITLRNETGALWCVKITGAGTVATSSGVCA